MHVVSQDQFSALLFVRFQPWQNLLYEGQRLPVIDCKGIAWCVFWADNAFIGNLPRTCRQLHEFQPRFFRAANGYAELTVFVSMFAGQCDSALTIDQARDVGRVCA